MISLLKQIVRGLARRLTQFKRAQNWAALLSAFLEEIQELEEAAVAVLEARNLDDATGEHLDLWGRLVGEYRLGKTDEDYRRFIKARLLRNTSQGNPDRQIIVLDLLTSPTRIILEELYPAQTRLWFLLDTNAPLAPFGTPTEDTLSEIMKDIGPTGVMCDAVVGVGTPFVLGSLNQGNPSFGGGLDSLNQNSATSGKLAGVV